MNLMEKHFEEKTGIVFKTYYKTWKPKLKFYLYKWTKSQELAEDFADEAFIQALIKIDTFDSEKSKLQTWLWTIGLNLIKKDYEDKKKMQCLSIDKPMSNEANMLLFIPYLDSEVEYQKQELINKKAELIKETIYNLPERLNKYKEVLILREIENMEYSEISEILNLNLNTIKSQIKKGREIIAKKVKCKFNCIYENMES